MAHGEARCAILSIRRAGISFRFDSCPRPPKLAACLHSSERCHRQSLHQQGIDTTTPAGKAMFQMMGVFAEFERSMIVERVRAGVARAKASGTKSGKAFGRPRVPAETEQRIRDALASPGRPGFHKIAAQFGVATGTVQRIAQTF
jgi:DNA invertase Pin-like site-specific DNA recombinase